MDRKFDSGSIGRRLHCNLEFYHCLVIISISGVTDITTRARGGAICGLRASFWHLFALLRASKSGHQYLFCPEPLADAAPSLPKTRSVRGLYTTFFCCGMALRCSARGFFAAATGNNVRAYPCRRRSCCLPAAGVSCHWCSPASIFHSAPSRVTPAGLSPRMR